MKSTVIAFALCCLWPPMLLAAGPGRLTLPDFAALERDAADSVNLTVEPWLLRSMAMFLDDKDADAAAMKTLIGSLKSVQIRNYEFDQDHSTAAELQSVRKLLATPAWTRMIETHSGKEQEDVDVYVMIDNERTCGLAVIVSHPRELTIVNVEGPIRVEDLAMLENHLHLPPLPPLSPAPAAPAGIL